MQAQDPSDCESVQFVSGISLDPPEPQWRRQHSAVGADYQLQARTDAPALAFLTQPQPHPEP